FLLNFDSTLYNLFVLDLSRVWRINGLNHRRSWTEPAGLVVNRILDGKHLSTLRFNTANVRVDSILFPHREHESCRLDLQPLVILYGANDMDRSFAVDHRDCHFASNDSLYRNVSIPVAAQPDLLRADHSIDHLDCFFLYQLLGLLDLLDKIDIAG